MAGRPTSPRAAIAAAIRKRQLLAFLYEGHPRAVEPHICGILNNGEPGLSAYQVAGSSGSGEPVGWKTFHLSGMQQVWPMARHFAGPRPDYNPQDPAFRSIEIRL